MVTKTQKELRKVEDVEYLTHKLGLDDIDIATDAREQPTLYLRAARYRVQKMRRRVKAATRLEVLRSEEYLRIRKNDREKGIRHRTETHIKILINRRKTVAAAQEELNEAMEEEELSKSLVHAYEQRGNQIRHITHLLGLEAAVDKRRSEAMDLAELRREVKKNYPGQVDE